MSKRHFIRIKSWLVDTANIATVAIEGPAFSCTTGPVPPVHIVVYSPSGMTLCKVPCKDSLEARTLFLDIQESLANE